MKWFQDPVVIYIPLLPPIIRMRLMCFRLTALAKDSSTVNCTEHTIAVIYTSHLDTRGNITKSRVLFTPPVGRRRRAVKHCSIQYCAAELLTVS